MVVDCDMVNDIFVINKIIILSSTTIYHLIHHQPSSIYLIFNQSKIKRYDETKGSLEVLVEHTRNSKRSSEDAKVSLRDGSWYFFLVGLTIYHLTISVSQLTISSWSHSQIIGWFEESTVGEGGRESEKSYVGWTSEMGWDGRWWDGGWW